MDKLTDMLGGKKKKKRDTSEAEEDLPAMASPGRLTSDDGDEKIAAKKLKKMPSHKSSKKERAATVSSLEGVTKGLPRSASERPLVTGSSSSSHKSSHKDKKMIKRESSAAEQAQLLKKIDELITVMKAAPLVAPAPAPAPVVEKKAEAQLLPPPPPPATMDEAGQFNRDVRRAFQFTTSLLMAGVLLILGYYVYLMIEDYVAPFFWAVLFSVILHRPKEILYNMLEPLRVIERQGGGMATVMKKKSTFLFTDVFMKPFIGACALTAISYVSCFVIGWGCWIPWVWFIAAGTVVFALLSIFLSISSSESLDSLLTTALVGGCLLVMVLFAGLFVFKAFSETAEFVWKIQTIIEAKIADPTWAEMLQENGITTEALHEHMETGHAYLDDWVTQQGYNLTEIQETVQSLTAEADAGEVVVADGEAGMFDFLYELDTDKLTEYYETATSAVDMDAVSEYASTFGGALFGTGAGIFGVFSSIVASLLEALDAVLQFIVFIGALLFFLESEESFPDQICRIVPVSRDHQRFLSNTIQQNVIQVFVSSLLLCIAHGAATWLYFSLLGLDFAYSTAFLTGVMALFPLTSPWLVYAPALLTAYVQGDGYVLYYAVGLFLLEQAVGGFIDPQIHEMIPGSSPYLTGIGLALGVATFGYQGVLIGPMLIVCLKTAFEMFCRNVAEPAQ